MNFYRRRPLAAAISLCIAVSAAAVFLKAHLKLLVILGVIILAGALIGIFNFYGIKRILNIPSAVFILMTAAFTVCLLIESLIYYDVYAAKYENLTEGRIQAVITDVQSSGYRSFYRVRLRSLNGMRVSATGVLLDELCDPLGLGDVIETDVVFSEFGDIYDYYDMPRLSTLAEGLVFACENEGEIDVVGRNNGLGITLARWRGLLGEKMSLYLDRDSGELSRALILGERDGLGKIRRDFGYIGVTHILALSGFHLTVISGILERVLRGIGIGRQARNVIQIIAILFYTALVGSLMSVVRAAIMIMLALIADMLSHENDRVTSLFVSVWFIILANPAAMFDISLQLSFFATLGVILMADSASHAFMKSARKRGVPAVIRRQLRGLAMSVLSSLGALLFLLPLQWIYFGEISTMSVPATLIISFICEGLLLLLLPYALFAALGWKVCAAGLAPLVSVLCAVCEKCAEFLSEYARLVSLRYPFALPIILCLGAVIVVMMVINVKSWLYSLIPLLAACALFSGCVIGYENMHREDITIDYVNDKDNDAFLLISERHAMIADVTDGSGASMNSIRAALTDRFLTNVDTLVLTRITRRHTSSVRALLRYRAVDRLLLPIPTDEYTYGIFEEIHRTAEEYGAEVTVYSTDSETDIAFGDARLFIPMRTLISRSAHPLTLLKFGGYDTEIVYFGSAAWESEYLWGFTEGTEYMIIGKNGPRFMLPPEGSIGEDVRYVAVSEEGDIERLWDWFSGYNGKMSCSKHHRINIRP